ADTFVDFDHGLNSAVARLREALNDSAERPRYIETVARRGYRFIGKLEDAVPPVAVVQVPANSCEQATSTPPTQKWRTPAAVLAGGGLVAGLAVPFFFLLYHASA